MQSSEAVRAASARGRTPFLVGRSGSAPFLHSLFTFEALPLRTASQVGCTQKRHLHSRPSLARAPRYYHHSYSSAPQPAASHHLSSRSQCRISFIKPTQFSDLHSSRQDVERYLHSCIVQKYRSHLQEAVNKLCLSILRGNVKQSFTFRIARIDIGHVIFFRASASPSLAASKSSPSPSSSLLLQPTIFLFDSFFLFCFRKLQRNFSVGFIRVTQPF